MSERGRPGPPRPAAPVVPVTDPPSAPRPEHHLVRRATADLAVRVRRLLTRAGLRAALPYVVAGLVLIVAVVALGREFERHLGAIEAGLAHLGPWGPVAFTGLFVVASSVFVPDTLLAVIAGVLFGLAGGAAAVVAGAVLASALQYALAHGLLRSRVDRMLASRPALAALQRAIVRDQLHLQVLIRLTPLNPATLSYLLGAAGVRFGGFLVACFAGAPNLIVAVYFGHAGTQVARTAAGGGTTSRLHEIVIIGGGLACVVALILVARLARRALLEAVAESGGPGGGSTTR